MKNSLRFSSSSLTQVSNWKWLASAFQTTTESVGLVLMRYSKLDFITSTTVAWHLSSLDTNFTCACLQLHSLIFSQSAFLINSILQDIFYVEQFELLNGTTITVLDFAIPKLLHNSSYYKHLYNC